MAAPDPSSWRLPRLRIDADGVWYHEDQEITHAGILGELQSNLRVDGEGHFLQAGPARVPVDVADAPFVVLRLETEGGGFVVTLGDMTREPLDSGTLRLGAGEIPYCRVKSGRFEARFSRAAAWELLQHVVYDEASGQATLAVGQTRRPIPRRERA